MNTRSCCVPSRHSSGVAVDGRGAKAKGAARWGVPALVLFLLPKCPMCIAAYVAMLTGIGLSMEAADWRRETTVAVCVLAIIVSFTRRMRRYPVSG